MEDDHFAVQVLTVDEHLAARHNNNDATRREAVDDEDEDDDESSTPTSVLIPVDSKERRSVLRAAGVDEINLWEKEECKQLRLSRQQCGCACAGPCRADSCGCAAGGIMCQVDRPGFPCGCSAEACGNPAGRLEFNPVKVRTHFVKTIMRTRIEEARSLQQQQQEYGGGGGAGGDYFNCNLGYLAQLYGAGGFGEDGDGGSNAADSPSTSQPTWTWADAPWWASIVGGAGLQEEEEQGEEEEEEESTSSRDSESCQDEGEESEPPNLLAASAATLATPEDNVIDIIDTVIDAVVCGEAQNAAGAVESVSSPFTESQCPSGSELYQPYSSHAGAEEPLPCHSGLFYNSSVGSSSSHPLAYFEDTPASSYPSFAAFSPLTTAGTRSLVEQAASSQYQMESAAAGGGHVVYNQLTSGHVAVPDDQLVYSRMDGPCLGGHPPSVPADIGYMDSTNSTMMMMMLTNSSHHHHHVVATEMEVATTTATDPSCHR
jgi:hypothetical protein